MQCFYSINLKIIVKKKIINIIKIIFVILSTTSFLIFVIIMLYKYNLLDNVLNYIK